jgi:hypothetical protein
MPDWGEFIMDQIVDQRGDQSTWEDLIEDGCVHAIVDMTVSEATPEQEHAFAHFHGEEARQVCIHEHGDAVYTAKAEMHCYLIDWAEKWYNLQFGLLQVPYFNSLNIRPSHFLWFVFSSDFCLFS